MKIEIEGHGMPLSTDFEELKFIDSRVREQRSAAITFVGTYILAPIAGGVAANYVFAWLRSGGKVLSLKIDGTKVDPDSIDQITNAISDKLSTDQQSHEK